MRVTDNRNKQVHQNNEDHQRKEHKNYEFQPIIVIYRISQVTNPKDPEVLRQIPLVFLFRLTFHRNEVLVIKEVLASTESHQHNHQERGHSHYRLIHHFIEPT